MRTFICIAFIFFVRWRLQSTNIVLSARRNPTFFRVESVLVTRTTSVAFSLARGAEQRNRNRFAVARNLTRPTYLPRLAFGGRRRSPVTRLHHGRRHRPVGNGSDRHALRRDAAAAAAAAAADR